MELVWGSECMCKVLMLIVEPNGKVTETYTCSRRPYTEKTEPYFLVSGNEIEPLTASDGRTISGEAPGSPSMKGRRI